MKIDRPGIYEMTKDEYLSDPCPEPALSHSAAVKLLQDSPLHAWSESRRMNPSWRPRHSEEMDRGTALHALFLEGENVMQLIEVEPDKNGRYAYRTDVARAQRDAAYAAGKVPAKPDEHDRMMSLLGILENRIGEVESARMPFSDGKPEQVVIWQDEGIWCRARLDWLADDYQYIDDLKTAASANPGRGFGQFGRAVWAYGYDVQAAFYRRGIKAVTGVDPIFRHVAFELSAPNALSVCRLGNAGNAVAEEKVKRAIIIWEQCLTDKFWPGYPNVEVELEPPDYEIAALEAAELF